MGKKHSPAFLKLCLAAKAAVPELTVDQVKAKIDAGESFTLIDVREESEWAEHHLPTAVYLGRGVIERDIEVQIPDTATPIVCYCGGGFRSALVVESLQKMGYTQAASMDGGISGWIAANNPLTKD